MHDMGNAQLKCHDKISYHLRTNIENNADIGAEIKEKLKQSYDDSRAVKYQP